MSRLSSANDNAPVRGPVIIETMWWPRHEFNHGLPARSSPDEWRDALRSRGVKPGDVIEFLAEHVCGRFSLIIECDGQYDADNFVQPPNTFLVSDDDIYAAKLDELAGALFTDASAARLAFPIEKQCRAVIVRDPIKMQLLYKDERLVFDDCDGGAP